MKLRKLNKKAQFESKLLAIVIIFIIGIILIFFNRLNNEIYDSFDEYFNESTTYNGSEAQIALNEIQDVDNSVWDYAFLAIFIGLILQIIIFSFATKINIAFFWIMLILDIPILIVAVIVSNIWQELAVSPEFVDTIARFPITNAILGTYYPIVAVVIFFFAAIILFGKRPGNLENE